VNGGMIGMVWRGRRGQDAGGGGDDIDLEGQFGAGIAVDLDEGGGQIGVSRADRDVFAAGAEGGSAMVADAEDGLQGVRDKT